MKEKKIKSICLSLFFILFVLILLFRFYRSISVGYYKESSFITEFLLNYQGGFVRRGFLGEILFQLYHYFGLSPYTGIITLSAVSLVALILFFTISFIKKGYPLFILPFSFFLGMPILSGYWVKKDALLLLLFIIVINWAKKTNKIYLFLINLFLIIGILMHESIGFFCIPILFLIWFDKNKHSFANHGKALIITLLTIAPSILAFLLVSYFKGSSEISVAIWESWKNIPFPQESGTSEIPLIIDSLSWTLKYGITFNFASFLSFDNKIFSPLIYLIFFVLIYNIVVNIKKIDIPVMNQITTVNLKRKTISGVFLIQIISIIPLFIVGCDFGRWLFLWIATSFSILILIPENKLLTILPGFLLCLGEKMIAFLDVVLSRSRGFLYLSCILISMPAGDFDGIRAFTLLNGISVVLQFISQIFYKIFVVLGFIPG